MEATMRTPENKIKMPFGNLVKKICFSEIWVSK
jgi:hypothetical protein